MPERFKLAGVSLGLLLLMLSSTACVHTSKWQWISGALHRSELTDSGSETNFAKPTYEGHPFRSVDFQQQLDKLTDTYLSSGNELRILADKDSTEAKLELIKSARSTIYMTVYLLMCDEGGQHFLAELAKAAQRGVDVRILMDGSLWSLSYGGSCHEKYGSNKIAIGRTPYSLLGLGDSVRLHEKLFIVDGAVAVTGGQNIGSNWADSTGIDENYRDTDVLVRGPVVNDIAYRFVNLWKIAHPKDAQLESYEALLQKRAQNFLKTGSAGVQNYVRWLNTKTPQGLCRFVVQDPQIGNHRVFDVYAAYARASQQQIMFHVPSLNGLGSKEQEELMASLVNASKRSGVQVDIITNGPGFLHTSIIPRPLGWLFGAYTLGQVYDSVLDTPINVFAYQYWLHSKVFSFDGIAVGIGSFNFDETGVDWIENTLICMDRDLAQSTESLFKRDLSYSKLLPKPATGNKTKTAAAAALVASSRSREK